MRVLLMLVGLVFSVEALAASEASVPAPRDASEQAAAAAFDSGDWAESARLHRRLAARRRWDDEVHNRLGYSLRKLGDYQAALSHYGLALELNPYHRGALEYLGEAYVEMGRLADARATLERLEQVCRLTDDASDWRARCEAWRDLDEAIRAGGRSATW